MSHARAAEEDATALPVDRAGLAVAPTPWPREVPTPDAAEAEVGAAVNAGGDSSALAARIASEVSELERSAYAGLSVADPVLLRAASGLRLRLATALATAPQRGPFDEAAVQQLLASADEVLVALAREASESNEQVAAALSAIRGDLVRDALLVSELQQRLATPVVGPAVAAVPTGPKVRVLSNESAEAPHVVESSRRRAGPWIVLALAVLAAGGYHVHRLYETKQAKAAMVRVDGAPDRVMASVEGRSGQVLFTPPGAPLTAPELQRLTDVQKARGRRVSVRAPGVYAIEKIGDGG